MKLLPGVTLLPILHGRKVFAEHIRKLCMEHKYDCIAVDLPSQANTLIHEAVEQLPFITAVSCIHQDSMHLKSKLFYIPTDPCDATIEALRQAHQNHLFSICIGANRMYEPEPLLPMPDEYATHSLGMDAYLSLCLRQSALIKSHAYDELNGQILCSAIRQLRLRYKHILAVIHLRRIIPVIRYLEKEQSYNYTPPKEPEQQWQQRYINNDHLYFALGELPFITGLYEKERHDIFSQPIDSIGAIKELFVQTRTNYSSQTYSNTDLSPQRLQCGLTFLRNLTIMNNRLIPSLFDIILAAKGIGGNAFALNIVKNAHYYPYFTLTSSYPTLSVSIYKALTHDTNEIHDACNLFKDTASEWRTVHLKPDPSQKQKKQYKYKWHPEGMCSHIPEDHLIENFNAHIRTKAAVIMVENFAKVEKFSTSVKDGIDIRETLRNWHTGSIYVKELPANRGNIDTVVIIFDADHDHLYTHQTTWYAENEQESTLTFYATDPFLDMVGPGIARSTYGGVSLLFPPKHIPSIFDLPRHAQITSLNQHITYGALLFSDEKTIAYISSKRPDVILKKIAAQLKKRILWIPLASFSSETIRRLRRFHILNGKEVRSWAARFIGSD